MKDEITELKTRFMEMDFFLQSVQFRILLIHFMMSVLKEKF
jgi:hypothetical protein